MHPNKQNSKICNSSYWGKYPSTRKPNVTVKVCISLLSILRPSGYKVQGDLMQ